MSITCIFFCHCGYLNSTFSDIFDEAHFIKSLQGDVRIIRELPKELESVPRARKHFSSWASANYYEELANLWKDYQVSLCVYTLTCLSFVFRLFPYINYV